MPILWRLEKSFCAPQGPAMTIKREWQWATNLVGAEAPMAPGPKSSTSVHPVTVIMVHEFLSRQVDSKITGLERLWFYKPLLN
jgi:hypothetical protein